MLLTYALLFLLLALIASVLGFSGVSVVATIIAAVCFGLFLGLFLDAIARGKRDRDEHAHHPRHGHEH